MKLILTAPATRRPLLANLHDSMMLTLTQETGNIHFNDDDRQVPSALRNAITVVRVSMLARMCTRSSIDSGGFLWDGRGLPNLKGVIYDWAALITFYSKKPGPVDERDLKKEAVDALVRLERQVQMQSGRSVRWRGTLLNVKGLWVNGQNKSIRFCHKFEVECWYACGNVSRGKKWSWDVYVEPRGENGRRPLYIQEVIDNYVSWDVQVRSGR